MKAHPNHHRASFKKGSQQKTRRSGLLGVTVIDGLSNQPAVPAPFEPPKIQFHIIFTLIL
jgi:hypothetical protein